MGCVQRPLTQTAQPSRVAMQSTTTLVLAAVLLLSVPACTDMPTDVAAPISTSAPMNVLGTLRGTVDLDRGTLTFSSVVPSTPAGMSAAIYGDQNVTVRLYNSPVVLDSSSSPWRWTASVGLRNLRPHHIGDEESSAAPVDTMGLYVFFVQDAAPGQPCPGCFARIASHHGVMSFSAPNQKFFYWHERLNPVGSPSGDTSRVRTLWTFETSPGVRSFSFVVLIAAPWAAPYESRWRIQYTADALPGTACPPWKTESWSPGGSASVSGGTLTIRSNTGGLLMYFRRDPIATTQNAYIQATARTPNGTSARPEIAMLVSDHAKLVALGISSNTVGIMTNAGLFLPGTTSSITSGTHDFQIRKYAADSAVWYVDGVRRGRVAYSSLSTDTFTTAPGAYVAFGAIPTSLGSQSTWDDVIYEI
jgi:hypothetical protein